MFVGVKSNPLRHPVAGIVTYRGALRVSIALGILRMLPFFRLTHLFHPGGQNNRSVQRRHRCWLQTAIERLSTDHSALLADDYPDNRDTLIRLGLEDQMNMIM